MVSLVVFLLFQVTQSSAQAVKVACIGNSVTYGYLLENPAKESYPSVLQEMLGTGYQVRNFGFSGATLLRKGHKPYFRTKEFTDALAFRADIAIVHLGLNDTDPRNWPNFKDDFAKDYAWLLDTLRAQNPKVKLYICRLTPIFSGHPRFKSGTREWYDQIQLQLPGIAMANGAELIDLNAAIFNHPELFPDNLHPNKTGAAKLASTVYKQLTGKYGGLKLPMHFTDHMVLQRDLEIPIYGIADAGQKINVVFNGLKLNAIADKYGKWKVSFPKMAAGGPYQLTVSEENKKIVLSDILIGDVWLCSGQSNMAFPLANAATGKNELAALKTNQKFRLLKFQVAAETDDQVWDSVTLQQVNNLQYFSGQWASQDAKHAAGFSAVAYYFGKNLVERTGVPIGLIQVAVGGSGIESWIDRKTMEQDNQLVDMLANWRKSDFLQDWVRGRADKNLQDASNPRQRHPYEPIYNYEAGISQLTGSPIKGVIWYQGESNAHNMELYERELPLLVSSWRKNWGIDFPFYYVQLSSIDRPSWPYFRDAERKLVNRIPNSGMAVSSDLGDSLNVHPVQKEEVGNRLALLALKHTYQKPVTAEGPAMERAEVRANEIILHFSQARQLSAKNKQPLTGFELVNAKGEHQMVKAIIKNNEVHIPLKAGAEIKAIAYGWRPFTRANLVNEANLPASTFYYPLNKD